MHLSNGHLVITTCVDSTLEHRTLPVDPLASALGHIRQLCTRQAFICDCKINAADECCTACTLAMNIFEWIPADLRAQSIKTDSVCKSGLRD